MSAKPHAFVAMPFGVKPGRDGTPIDFNRVYREYIAPALDAAGLEPFRADEERRAGDIRSDMFQELLIADLVIADLTIDNPNVWYELGVRHALRSRGVVLVSGGRVTTAFDVYTDRKLRYGLKDGAPDPATLEQDRQALVEMIRQTMESWHGRKISPVYKLLPHLQEPDWKTLRVGDVREFWEKHGAWERRIDLAGRTRRIGDLLVLAEEAPVAAFRAEAWFKAGAALRKAKQFAFALEYLDRGLAIAPDDLPALRERGICLQRLALARAPGHSLERVREHYRDVLTRFPKDAETWALLGRVDKDAWTESWRAEGRSPDAMRDDAAYEDAVLRSAIASYAQGYRTDLAHYYSGINALTLMHLYRHLTGRDDYDAEISAMAPAVRFAALGESDPKAMFWALATLGDLEVLTGTPEAVRKTYKEAIAKNASDWFALSSVRAQLQLLADLGFRPDAVGAGLATFDRALERLVPPDARKAPRQIWLFSGHRVDAPTRATPRFPADKVPVAAKAIDDALDRLGAGPGDLALSQAAAGGDLLFVEACQRRGVRCEILLPFPEPEFIRRSVLPSQDGDAWRERYYAAKAKLEQPPRIMPTELGPPPKGVDPFERCNLWLLYTALALDMDKVRFIALWDGSGGDGPGGTEHMYKEVQRHTGRVTWLDTRKLWGSD